MTSTRQDIARAAADALERAARRPLPRALVGFDGFVDRLVRMVATRRSMALDDFEPIRTIPEFAARCAAAAGRSTNIEQVARSERFGGNGPLMAGALARLGMPTTFIGAIAPEVGGGGDPRGAPGASTPIHPVFRGFAARCERVVPLCPPSWTLCMEFDDGKIMLNDTARVQAVTWERVVGALGLDELRRLFEGSRLIGIVNWSLLGGVPGIWRGIARDILPAISRTPLAPRTLFVDLSDPAKRRDEDIDAAIGLLRELVAGGLEVILGLNLAEAARVGFRGSAPNPLAGEPDPDAILRAARHVRDAVGVPVVVVHPRHGAAGATGGGEGAWFDGPFTRSPTLSTGAGDHFNAGFALSRVLGLPLDQCLACGCAESGLYVRTGEGPTLAELVAFLRALPEPETPRPSPQTGAHGGA